jgi:hypothetical protein
MRQSLRIRQACDGVGRQRRVAGLGDLAPGDTGTAGDAVIVGVAAADATASAPKITVVRYKRWQWSVLKSSGFTRMWNTLKGGGRFERVASVICCYMAVGGHLWC